ncbi:hypothetical protein NE857_33855 (plasmid) [Nocardiopsis exhalans]|uniref:Uncharacterized protein n=1 Tax=Nocardiopsis exhalans TaxID=163604 RepID=A0ABY5DHU1_9ACTN|nr:hypothetical protein [Nocardiopsis exhalans]USY23617.1 hypothetical protein NE857_33855 [Nocardiopsis exhalans]
MSPYQHDHERLAWLIFTIEQDLGEGRTSRAKTSLTEGYEIYQRHGVAANRILIDRLEKLKERQNRMSQAQAQELTLRHYQGDEHGQGLRGALQGYGVHVSIHVEESDNYDHTVRLHIGYDDESSFNPVIEVEGEASTGGLGQWFTLIP